MKQVCKFCNERDLQVHVPALHIDIAKAIESGVVQPMERSVVEFNHIDIEQVPNVSRVRDTFDVLEYKASLKTASTEFSSGTGNVTTHTSTSTSTGDSNTAE